MSPAHLTIYCGLLLSLSAFSADIMLPTFFDMQRDLGAPIEAVQATVPVFLFLSAFAQLFFGPLSDRIGRRKALLAGLACYLTGGTAALLSPSIAAVLGGRALQGFGAGCAQVVPRAVLRDLHQGPELARSMAFAMAIFSFGPIFAPLVGTLLTELGGWRVVFGAMLTFGCLLALFALLRLPETNKQPDPDALDPARLWSAFKRVLGHPQSRFFLVLAGIGFFAIVSFVTNAPRIYKSAFGIEGPTFAILFSATGVGIIIGQTANHRLIARLGALAASRLAATVLTSVAALVVVLSLAGALNAAIFTLLMFAFNTSFLVVVANSASLVLDPHKEIAGFAASLFGFSCQMTAGVLTMITVPIYKGEVLPWATGLLLVMGGVLTALLLYRRPASA